MCAAPSACSTGRRCCASSTGSIPATGIEPQRAARASTPTLSRLAGEGGAQAARPGRLGVMRILLSDVAEQRHGARIREAAPDASLVAVPPEGPLPDPAGAGIAFVTRDLFVGGTRHRLNPRFLRFTEFLQAAP